MKFSVNIPDDAANDSLCTKVHFALTCTLNFVADLELCALAHCGSRARETLINCLSLDECDHRLERQECITRANIIH